MVFRKKNLDLVTALRGDGDGSSSAPSALVPTMHLHKIQRPNGSGADPVMSARASSDGVKRQGSIGVGGGGGTLNGASAKNGSGGNLTGILKGSSRGGFLSPRSIGDESSLESIGVLRVGDFPDDDDDNGGDGDGQGEEDVGLSLSNVNTFDDGLGGAADTLGGDTLGSSGNDSNKSPRRVQWGADVKPPKHHGCFYGGMPSVVGDIGSAYQGLVDNLSDLKIVSKLEEGARRLESGARRLNGGLKGLGMTCAGGGRALCGTCGTVLRTTDCLDGSSECRCAKCGLSEVRAGGGADRIFAEENGAADLLYSPRYNGDEGAELLREARDAIQESRDAIAATRDAIMGSYEEMRESRQCVAESRDVLAECREAIIQSNNVAMLARREELARAVAGKDRFAFEELGHAERERQEGGGGMYYKSSALAKYRHSPSLRESARESANNVETGMGDNFDSGIMSPRNREEDPVVGFTIVSPRGEDDAPPPPRTTPASILRRSRAPAAAATPTENARANASRLGRRYRNMNFTTKNVTVKGAKSPEKPTASAQDAGRQHQQPLQQQQQQQRKKKKTISRLVIGGMKKPLKFMSHGVKSNLKTSRGPKRILAITATIPSSSNTARHYRRTPYE